MPAEPLSTAQALFEELRSEGEACLERWRDDQQEEGVNLECKRPAEGQHTGMARADIKQLAETASAFANSEGGVLIFGVDAREQNGRDAIQQLMPIANIDAFERTAQRVKADLLSPAHSGIEIISIPAKADPSAGYLIVRVDQSDRRPHRSLKDQVYYRRSRDRTFPMEHSDLKDAMSRAAGPELQVSVDFADIRPNDHHSIDQAASFTILISISIENVGAAMARYPFLHLELSPGGSLYSSVTDRRMAPAWPRSVNENNDNRLQGRGDDVIPVSTKTRVAYALWTYRRDTASVGGMPLAQAYLGVGGVFGCDGFRTHGFSTLITTPELITELQKRNIPLTALPNWQPL